MEAASFSSYVQLYIDLSYYSPTGYQPPVSSLKNSSDATCAETGGAARRHIHHHEMYIGSSCTFQNGKNSPFK